MAKLDETVEDLATHWCQWQRRFTGEFKARRLEGQT